MILRIYTQILYCYNFLTKIWLGVESWVDGARYEGTYKEGAKHGKGKFFWADGAEYEGEFKDNNIDGTGVYKWSDGRFYEGSWAQNQMHGKGVFIWPDGRKFTGDYVFDQKQGFGVFEWYMFPLRNALIFWIGLMEENTLESGRMVYNME